MNPITAKLFAIPVAVASLIMAFAFSTNERKEAIVVRPVVEQAIDPVTNTMAPHPETMAVFVAEEKRIEEPVLTIEQAQQKYGRCGQWHDLAIAIGWPEEEWPIMSYVLHRESRCNIDSWNKTDPASGSRGLMQINGSWCRPNKWNPHPAGWLGAQGILDSCDDLFDPQVNLRAGLAIWLYGENKHGCGWRGPWATSCNYQPSK